MKALAVAGFCGSVLLPTVQAVAQQNQPTETIGLDTLIHAVVNDIRRAARPTGANKSGPPVFDLGETQLELKFTVEKNASGKVEASFFGAGAETGAGIKDEKIQTVIIKLLPSRESTKSNTEDSNVQFSAFDPSEKSFLLPSRTYDALFSAAISKRIKETVPNAVDAIALGVAKDGVVVNADAFKRWADALEKEDPSLKATNFLTDATAIEIPDQLQLTNGSLTPSAGGSKK